MHHFFLPKIASHAPLPYLLALRTTFVFLSSCLFFNLNTSGRLEEIKIGIFESQKIIMSFDFLIRGRNESCLGREQGSRS